MMVPASMLTHHTEKPKRCNMLADTAMPKKQEQHGIIDRTSSVATTLILIFNPLYSKPLVYVVPLEGFSANGYEGMQIIRLDKKTEVWYNMGVTEPPFHTETGVHTMRKWQVSEIRFIR